MTDIGCPCRGPATSTRQAVTLPVIVRHLYDREESFQTVADRALAFDSLGEGTQTRVKLELI